MQGATDLGDRLGLIRLLGGIRSDTLSLDPLCFRVLFLVRAKQVDFVVIFFRSSRGRVRGRGGQCLASL